MPDITGIMVDELRLIGDLENNGTLNGEISSGGNFEGTIVGAKGPKGDPGTTVYSELTDKPQIEGVTLVGNKSFEDLNLNKITNSEMENMLNI